MRKVTKYTLDLSFSPLFDARIALRECDTFFFGTAQRIDGKNSSSEVQDGRAKRKEGFQRAVAAAAARIGRLARPEEEKENKLDRNARDMFKDAVLCPSRALDKASRPEKALIISP